MEIIVVPDVHGRMFWKQGRDYLYNNPEAKVVFLGDYLDPYTTYDGITHAEAYENFLDILEFKKENLDNVVLLRGNHDEWNFNEFRECCRHDYRNTPRNRKIFQENENLFKFAHLEGNYLFTHAGVSTDWLDQNSLDLNESSIVEYLNSNPNTLWQIGRSRGGRNRCGSPLWCCWEGDWQWNDCQNPFSFTQCIGHTYDTGDLRKLDSKNIYCFDCAKCFIINTETKEIKKLNGL